ncbi:MAG: hypothetical protein JNG89_12300 [Planctomycetaceae bacterium]|nr:hypothetical protein [Planctomycetaceae bacterium]
MSEIAAQPDAAPRDSAALAWLCRLVIVVSTALSIARLMQAEPLQSANDRSRWCTVRALVEQGTYRIDDARRVPGWDTIDLVKSGEHFYSTKPPLLATLVAGLYWTVRHTLGWTLGNHLEATTRLILCVINVFPMTIALTLLLRLVRKSSLTSAACGFATILTALTAGFATLLLPFVTTFNNHTPAAFSIVFALYALNQIFAENRQSGWWFAAAGFWSAIAFTCELPAAAFLVAIAGWLAVVSFRRTLLWFVPAAIVPLAAFFATNMLVTGGPMPFYSAYGSELYEFVHEGVPSYWMHPRGIDKNIDSFPAYLVHCVIGHHGLLSLSPIFVLTLLGWTRAARDFAARRRSHEPLTTTLAGFAPIQLLGAALTLITLAFYLTRTANYNYGGVSVALRWMLWLVPFWLLAIPVAFKNWEPGRTARSLIGSALALSVFSAWCPFSTPWRQPWLFDVMTRAGWIDYSDPPPQLERPLTTWVSRLPDAPHRDPDYWVELSGRGIENIPVSIRIADGGRDVVAGTEVRIVEVTEMRDGHTTLSTYAVDPVAFAATAPPSAFLQWPDGTDSAVTSAAEKFWTGIPGDAANYRAAAERYLRLSLRTDAFRCLQSYTSSTTTDVPTGRSTHQRCDVWICDELPFGVAQRETQILDDRRQLLTRQRLTVTAAGKTLTAP